MAINTNAQDTKQKYAQRQSLKDKLFLAGLTIFALIWMAPIIWTVVTSFRPEPALQRNLASFIPYPFTTEKEEEIMCRAAVT